MSPAVHAALRALRSAEGADQDASRSWRLPGSDAWTQPRSEAAWNDLRMTLLALHPSDLADFITAIRRGEVLP